MNSDKWLIHAKKINEHWKNKLTEKEQNELAEMLEYLSQYMAEVHITEFINWMIEEHGNTKHNR